MRIIFHNATLAARDEPRAYKDVLYEAISEQQEMLIEGAYYRVKGLLVMLPPDPVPPRLRCGWTGSGGRPQAMIIAERE